MLPKRRFNWDAKVHINAAIKNDLHWWLTNLPNSSAPIHLSNPSVTQYRLLRICLGGDYMNGIQAQGMFSERELQLSINTKETLAIWYSIQSFRYLLENKHFLVLSDNCTAIANVKKFGGMQSELRDKISRHIWEFVTKMNSWLSISFIPGRDNRQADLASRVINCRTEWALPLQIFKKICIHFQFVPKIDLFASRLNYKLKNASTVIPQIQSANMLMCLEYVGVKILMLSHHLFF